MDCQDASARMQKKLKKSSGSGSNSRGGKYLKEIAPLHKWPQKVSAIDDDPTERDRVKVRTLAFTILGECTAVNQAIGNLNLPHEYGMQVVKIEERSGAYNCIDRPHRRHTLMKDDRVYVLFEAEPAEAPARTNMDLVKRFSTYYTVSEKLETDKTAHLADEALWSTKFRKCVLDFCLQDPLAELTCESFDCFEVQYPNEAPPAWVGSPSYEWVKLTKRPLPEVQPEMRNKLRALDMRNTFKTSPVMICRCPRDDGERHYVLPAVGATIVYGGDLMIFLCDEGPGAKNNFQLDQKVWRGTFQNLTFVSYLEQLPFAFHDALALSSPPATNQARDLELLLPTTRLKEDDLDELP